MYCVWDLRGGFFDFSVLVLDGWFDFINKYSGFFGISQVLVGENSGRSGRGLRRVRYFWVVQT